MLHLWRSVNGGTFERYINSVNSAEYYVTARYSGVKRELY